MSERLRLHGPLTVAVALAAAGAITVSLDGSDNQKREEVRQNTHELAVGIVGQAEATSSISASSAIAASPIPTEKSSDGPSLNPMEYLVNLAKRGNPQALQIIVNYLNSRREAFTTTTRTYESLAEEGIVAQHVQSELDFEAFFKLLAELGLSGEEYHDLLAAQEIRATLAAIASYVPPMVGERIPYVDGVRRGYFDLIFHLHALAPSGRQFHPAFLRMLGMQKWQLQDRAREAIGFVEFYKRDDLVLDRLQSFLPELKEAFEIK